MEAHYLRLQDLAMAALAERPMGVGIFQHYDAFQVGAIRTARIEYVLTVLRQEGCTKASALAVHHLETVYPGTMPTSKEEAREVALLGLDRGPDDLVELALAVQALKPAHASRQIFPDPGHGQEIHPTTACCSS